MAFDDKKLGPVFPTHPATPFDHTTEKRMIASVGGAGGVRSRVHVGVDGDKTFLKTRCGHPVLWTDPKKPGPEFTPLGVGDFACRPLSAAGSCPTYGYGETFTFDGSGKSTAGTNNGDHPHVMFPPVIGEAPDAWRWPEVSDYFDLTVDPLYGTIGVFGRVKMIELVESEYVERDTFDSVCISYDGIGHLSNKVYMNGRVLTSFTDSNSVYTYVKSVAIAKNWIYITRVSKSSIDGTATVHVAKARLYLQASGIVTVIYGDTKTVASGLDGDVGIISGAALSENAKTVAIFQSTVDVVLCDISNWSATWTTSSVDISDLYYDDTTVTPTPPAVPNNGSPLTTVTDRGRAVDIVWIGSRLYVLAEMQYAYSTTTRTYEAPPNQWRYVDAGTANTSSEIFLIPITGGALDSGNPRTIFDGHYVATGNSDTFDDYYAVSTDIRVAEIYCWTNFTGKFFGKQYEGIASYSGSGADPAVLGFAAPQQIGRFASGGVVEPYVESLTGVSHDFNGAGGAGAEYFSFVNSEQVYSIFGQFLENAGVVENSRGDAFLTCQGDGISSFGGSVVALDFAKISHRGQHHDVATLIGQSITLDFGTSLCTISGRDYNAFRLMKIGVI